MGFFDDLWGGIVDVVDWMVDVTMTPIEWIGDIFSFDMPDMPSSPTYDQPDRIGNTISEGIFASRCYGKCKIGGNKIRFNDSDDSDLRIIVAHCQGVVEGSTEIQVNDIEWSELTGSHTKTEYTGTRSQTVDARFSTNASAYRSIAYTAFTFAKNDNQVGYNPNITTVMEGLLCAPLAGGADAFTRNPAVILYDWYLNVEGYSSGDLDLNAFKSLEELCDEVPTGGTLPRYRFDFNIDSNMPINDAKKMIWASFNGMSIMSQGEIKPIWDSAQIADGSGSLTAKTVSHAFDLDNIAKGSFTWKQLEQNNLIRINFKDSSKNYKNSSVEMKDEIDINENGEILYEENAWFITDAEIARRRAKYKYNLKRYPDYSCTFSSLSGAGDIEIYDLVTLTHPLPGWTTKQFIITSRGEDEVGRMKFTAIAYYSGCYDDSEVATQENFESTLPNPYSVPASSTSIGAAMTAVGTAYDFDAVRVTFTPPNDPFYSYSEIYASNDDSTYYYVGQNGTGEFTFSALGVIYEPGDTCYIKLKSISENGVPEDLPGSADTSVSVTSTMRIGSFYAGTNDFWGGNAAINNAATTIVMGNLDGTSKIALGPSADSITFAGTQTGFYVDGDGNLRAGGAQSLKWNPSSSLLTIGEWLVSPNGISDNFTENDATILIDKTNALMRLGATGSDYLTLDGANKRIRSSNYVSGIQGAGFNLDPDLLEVGNIASRGIIRTAVFQKDVVSAVGGNLAVLDADVLATDMTAADASTLEVEGNTSFIVGDILRIKDGTDDEWLEVTGIVSAPIYSVTRDKAAAYSADSNPAWVKGASVINYGASGSGGIFMTASESNAPYMSVFTHAGSPWSSVTTRGRFGNLNGFLGYSTDLFGIALGETTKYLKYDPTNGLRISGDIDASTITGATVTGSTIIGGIIKTATSGRRMQIDSEGIKFITGASTGKYGTNFKYGDGTKYGTGYLAYFYNTTTGIPFYIQSEQTVADIHYYNRTSDPSGAAEIGDTAVVGGKLKICTVAGTPGTWTVCGTQT